MLRSFCLNSFAVVAVMLVGATAFAQTRQDTAPPATQTPASLVGSTWVGKENVPGYGKLTFRFIDAQKVQMIDAQSNITGSYTFSNGTVRITFGDCVYEGAIQGNIMGGNARFNSGSHNGVAWQWAVQLQPAAGR